MATDESVEDAIRMLRDLPREGSFALTFYSDETGHDAKLGVGDHGQHNAKVLLGLVGVHGLAVTELIDEHDLSRVFEDADRLARIISDNPMIAHVDNGGDR